MFEQLLFLLDRNNVRAVNVKKIIRDLDNLHKQYKSALKNYDPANITATDNLVSLIDRRNLDEIDRIVLNLEKWQIDHTRKTTETHYHLEAGLLTVGLLFSLFLSLTISGSILQPFGAMKDYLGRIGEGDLDFEVHTDGQGETGELLQTIDTMRSRLQKSAQETERILKTLNEGLFLINPDLSVSNRYSEALREILDIREPEGVDFPNFISSRFSPALSQAGRAFLELMFQGRHDEEMLASLNPLRELEYRPPSSKKVKHLRFRFQAIRETNVVVQVMVSVEDKTAQTVLKRQLEETRKKSEERQELLYAILQVDPEILAEFMEDYESELRHLGGILRPFSQNENQDRLLTLVGHSLHSIKGMTGVLGLTPLESRIHSYEELLVKLHSSDRDEEDIRRTLLGVMRSLQVMRDELQDLLTRMIRFQNVFQNRKGQSSFFILEIAKSIERTGRHLAKQVEFVHDKFDISTLPRGRRKEIKDVLVQLARNAISHGLEDPEERTSAGKPATGKIDVEGKLENKSYMIRFRDDGRGLDLEKLKKWAMNSGQWSGEEIEAWSRDKVANLIFEKGLSTASSVSKISGRGMGMGLVRDRLREMGGKIHVDFHSGEFCEFKISIPANAA